MEPPPCEWTITVLPKTFVPREIGDPLPFHNDSQAGIKITGKNINNLSYADDTTLMAENEDLQYLLTKVKEESEKVSLKLSFRKTKIMATGPTISWQIGKEEVEVVTDFTFLRSKITAEGDCSQEIKKQII